MDNSPFELCDYAACPYCYDSKDVVVTESNMSTIALDSDGTPRMVVPFETIYRAYCMKCNKPIHPIPIPGRVVRFRFAPMESKEIATFLASLDLSSYFDQVEITHF